MPAPGTTPPKFGPRPAAPEVRRAQPVFDRPSWIVGKRTYIGLIISTIGLIGSRFHVDVPTEEINGILDWFAVNWDAVAELAGLVLAAWGRFKASQRFSKSVAQ